MQRVPTTTNLASGPTVVTGEGCNTKADLGQECCGSPSRDISANFAPELDELEACALLQVQSTMRACEHFDTMPRGSVVDSARLKCLVSGELGDMLDRAQVTSNLPFATLRFRAGQWQ